MNETYIELDTQEGSTFKRKLRKFSIYASY
jgi:hypothetical protein